MILSKVIKYGKEHYKFLNMTILTKKQNAHHVEYYIGKVCLFKRFLTQRYLKKYFAELQKEILINRETIINSSQRLKEEDIIKKYKLAKIDLLKVGHHGSKTSSSKEFINKINPKYSIISVGRKNKYGHPNKEVLNNLDNSKIYRTDQDGSIMFKIKDNKLEIETYSP